MNKKLFLLLTAGAIALFFACSGEVVESTGKADLALTVTVLDAVSGDLLEADVSLNGGKPQQAKNGIAVFKEVTIGTHTLRAKIDGYAEVSTSTILSLTTGQTSEIARSYNAEIQLQPLTSSLWGYLTYEDETGAKRPVPADVEVKLELSGNSKIVNRLYTAKTDADGKYSFEKLPAVTYSLWVQESKIGNINYARTNITTSGTNLKAGGAVLATENPTLLSNKTNLFAVSDYPSIIQFADIDKPIKFKFTEAVDRSKITNTSITVSSTTTVPNITWNADNTELTLTPMGKWAELTGVSLNITSISGKTISGTYDIKVLFEDLSAKTIALVLLSDTATDKVNNSYTVYFKYNKIPGATNYTVYTNDNTKGIYTTKSATSVSETEGERIQSVTISNITQEVGILVQARNSNSKTQLDESKAIKIKDVVKPSYSGVAADGKHLGLGNDTLASRSVTSENLINTTFFTTTDQTSDISVYFNESVQVGDIEYEWINGGGNATTFSRVSVERVWNPYNDRVSFGIKIAGSATPPSAGANLDGRLIIKGIKDASGNPFEVKYLNGSGTVIGTKDHATVRIYTTGF